MARSAASAPKRVDRPPAEAPTGVCACRRSPRRRAPGGGFDANLGLARQALQRFGDDELRQLLNRSGLGDHPAVLRAFARAGRATKGFRTPPKS
jgi:hypothetical protein